MEPMGIPLMALKFGNHEVKAFFEPPSSTSCILNQHQTLNPQTPKPLNT